ncbi:hypothetical protein [Natronobeatus ordinarius]|uniref:hypothetical protein n=1 Tax=Natronobeatus ordinarius TaxID=2963433 RepID=UPI0020CC21BE|nr:hypothetical protein [Natronobeatus ordinarius]
MAREPSVLEDEVVGSADDSTGDGSTDGFLHRRSYLKLAGAAAAVSTGTAVAATATAAEYDVIELDPGERRVVRVNSGETFENVLFDVSANGAGVAITARGTNWTIRNIGFRGRHSLDGPIFGVADTGDGESTIENVYMGDGTDAPRQQRYPSHGIWVAPDHSGHLEIDGVYVYDANDNAFYASAPGSNGNGRLGSVHIKNCYARDNWVSSFRLARGRVENCVAVNTSSGRNGRPLWVWPTNRHNDEVEVVDCHFIAGPYPYAAVLGAASRSRSVDVYMENVQTRGTIQHNSNNLSLRDGGGNGNDARHFVPEGCPESPEEAASGAASTGSGSSSGTVEPEPEADDEDEFEHVLLFDGNDEAVTRYEFVVDGDVSPSNYQGATIDDGVVVEDGHASGVVANWKDAFYFNGDLEELTVDGPATVYLDDEAIDPDEYGEELPHVLEVEGQGEAASFEVTVDGEIAYAGEGESTDEVTIVSGTTVESSITEGSQAFRFSGVIASLTITGEVRVTVDGEEIDPDEYGEELLPHALVIDGTEASGPSTYSFRVDGRVARPNFDDPSVDENVIEGRAIRGIVSDWLEAYWFDGELTDCTVLGDANVYIQYNARDQ